MSEDQFQRQVDFIVEQQAKFSIEIAKLEQSLAISQKESRENLAKLVDVITSLANHSDGQDETMAAHDRQIAALIEAGKETDRRFRETDERFRETDERINALILLAERYFGRNGQQPSDE